MRASHWRLNVVHTYDTDREVYRAHFTQAFLFSHTDRVATVCEDVGSSKMKPDRRDSVVESCPLCVERVARAAWAGTPLEVTPDVSVLPGRPRRKASGRT